MDPGAEPGASTRQPGGLSGGAVLRGRIRLDKRSKGTVFARDDSDVTGSFTSANDNVALVAANDNVVEVAVAA